MKISQPLRTLPLLVAPLLFSSCFWDEPWVASADAGPVDQDLIGTWEGTREDVSSRLVVEPGEDNLLQATFTFGDDQSEYTAWTEESNGLMLASIEGQGENADKYFLGLYEIDGDKLSFALAADEDAEPPYSNPSAWLETHRNDLSAKLDQGGDGVLEFTRVSEGE